MDIKDILILILGFTNLLTIISSALIFRAIWKYIRNFRKSFNHDLIDAFKNIPLTGFPFETEEKDNVSTPSDTIPGT